MTTRFVPGGATAYVAGNVIALDDRAVVDVGFAASSANSNDLPSLLAAAADWRHGAIVVHDQFDHRLSLAVIGAVAVDVGSSFVGRRIVGEPAWTQHSIDGPERVTIAVGEAIDGITDDALTHCIDGGVVPASVIRRRFAPPAGDSTDPFDALFGRTAIRTVEDAAVRPRDEARNDPLGVLVFSTGERVMVDRPMVLGRNPKPSADLTATTRLVRLASPGVSRRHASILVDRWHATIDDLGSSNGTRITYPGGAPSPLVPGSPADLVIGAVVDLGGDVSFVVEEVA
jgi:FHA domain